MIRNLEIGNRTVKLYIAWLYLTQRCLATRLRRADRCAAPLSAATAFVRPPTPIAGHDPRCEDRPRSKRAPAPMPGGALPRRGHIARSEDTAMINRRTFTALLAGTV